MNMENFIFNFLKCPIIMINMFNILQSLEQEWMKTTKQILV